LVYHKKKYTKRDGWAFVNFPNVVIFLRNSISRSKGGDPPLGKESIVEIDLQNDHARFFSCMHSTFTKY
jgi:hypothetical protein